MDRAWPVKILHSLADIYLQSLDWRQALKAYEQICMLSPTDEKARANMVEINYRLGQQSKAIAELDNYLNYLNNQSQKEKILPFLEYLVNEAPGIIPVRRRLVEQYRRASRVEDAVAQLDAIADLLLRAGDKDSAIKVIEEILAMKPANASKYQQVLFQIKMGGAKSEGD
jgi:tetratricopeptide (TPR) repeat protein